MSNTWEDEGGAPAPAGERRDLRPDSVRSQDRALWEYAVRNRLLRGRGPAADLRGDAQGPEGARAGRRPRRRRRGAHRAAARAEGVYRRIAPADQEYPLQAVTLVRRMLDEGAPDAFVQDKYQAHARDCDEFGVPPMPLIPYLAELLEVFLLDTKLSRRNGTARERFLP